MQILLVHDIPDWKSLEPGRFNQVYQNQMNDHPKLVGEHIANCGATSGAGWKLEPSPIAKPADDAAA
jgi:hypothetical protein